MRYARSCPVCRVVTGRGACRWGGRPDALAAVRALLCRTITVWPLVLFGQYQTLPTSSALSTIANLVLTGLLGLSR